MFEDTNFARQFDDRRRDGIREYCRLERLDELQLRMSIKKCTTKAKKATKRVSTMDMISTHLKRLTRFWSRVIFEVNA